MIPGSRGCDNLPVGRIVVCVVLFCFLIVIIFRFVNFQLICYRFVMRNFSIRYAENKEKETKFAQR